MIFQNTFKPTIRHLLRDKAYLLVNLLSLAVGLLCCLFIFKYVQHEWSYDRFHKGADRIFRIESEERAEDGTRLRDAFLNSDLHQAASQLYPQIPDIERAARFKWTAATSIKANGEIYSDQVLSADTSFFNIFSFNVIEGDPQSILKRPNSVVITRSTAEKYFGTLDVMGKNLIVRSWQRNWKWEETLLTITGIVEDVPVNSHFSFDLVRSVSDVGEMAFSYNYVRVGENVSASELEKKLNDLYRQYVPADEFSTSQFLVQPLTAIHLHSSANGELSANNDVTYVYLFTIIAFIILGIACVNFATLATARSVKRARETAMRKVFGAAKGDLITAFLLEGALLSFIALLLGYLLGWFLLPYFNMLAGKSISFGGLIAPGFVLVMMGVTLLTGLLAGWYPALVLSRHKPSRLLQKDVLTGSRGDLLWKSMVIIQIAISLMLISCTYLVHKQIRFVFTKDLGFEKEQIITFFNNFGTQGETFLDQLNKHSNIVQTAGSGNIPGIRRKPSMVSVDVEGQSEPVTFHITEVGYQFFELYDISITEGRNFSDQFSSDYSEAFIINETAVASLGWTDPVGKRIRAVGRSGYVVGVVEDFNFLSLHNEITPMIFFMYDAPSGWLSVKMRSAQQLPETLSYIQTLWEKWLPDVPFEYNFVDDQFEALYRSEQQARSLFFSFSVLAVIIAALGLFSFASYTIQQKTREIGIRKVLGATVYDILKLFYMNYAKLLIIATLIALPAGYIWMNNWLQNFSYQTEIGPDALGIPLLLALVILGFSVSYQVVKGALRNPAETIRAE